MIGKLALIGLFFSGITWTLFHPIYLPDQVITSLTSIVQISMILEGFIPVIAIYDSIWLILTVMIGIAIYRTFMAIITMFTGGESPKI